MIISQEQFDTVLNGIRTQGGPSYELGNGCRYRSRTGRRCAAGWLMTGYDPEWEGKLVARYMLPDDVDLVAATHLQCIHDAAKNLAAKNLRDRRRPVAAQDWEFFDEWEPEMAKFAAYHGLTYRRPEDATDARSAD